MHKTIADYTRDTYIMIMLSLLKSPTLPDLIQPSGPG